MDKSKIISAYIFLIFATALWGGNIVAAKIASIITLEPIKLSFYRNLVVIIILLPLVFNKIKIIYEIFKKNWKIIINDQIKRIDNIKVYLRNPYQRYISGVWTHLQNLIKEDPTLDENTILKLIKTKR